MKSESFLFKAAASICEQEPVLRARYREDDVLSTALTPNQSGNGRKNDIAVIRTISWAAHDFPLFQIKER